MWGKSQFKKWKSKTHICRAFNLHVSICLKSLLLSARQFLVSSKLASLSHTSKILSRHRHQNYSLSNTLHSRVLWESVWPKSSARLPVSHSLTHSEERWKFSLHGQRDNALALVPRSSESSRIVSLARWDLRLNARAHLCRPRIYENLIVNAPPN